MTDPVILGRQPEVLHFTPSKTSPWYGQIVPGQCFTAQQLMGLRHRALDPEAVEHLTVKRNATDREMYWGIGQMPPQYHFQCPILGRRADGKVSVIAPSGDAKLINPDGWVGKPGKPKRPFW